MSKYEFGFMPPRFRTFIDERELEWNNSEYLSYLKQGVVTKDARKASDVIYEVCFGVYIALVGGVSPLRRYITHGESGDSRRVVQLADKQRIKLLEVLHKLEEDSQLIAFHINNDKGGKN